MPDFELTDPNGRKFRVTAPEGATPEQVMQFAQQNAGQAAAPPQETDTQNYMRRVGENLKFGASAAARGAMGLPAVAADVANWMGNKLHQDNPTGVGQFAGPATAFASMAQAGVNKLFPPKEGEHQHEFDGFGPAVAKFGVQPTTPTEKTVAAGIEGLAGALTGPGAAEAPIRTAAVGLGSGFGSDIGGRLTNDSWWGRLLGGLAGGTVAGTGGYAAARQRPQSATVAKDSIMGITPEQLTKAQEFMNDAKKQNPSVEMDLAQALQATGAQTRNMAKLRDALASNVNGKEVQGVLQRQQPQYQMLADDTLNNLPGPAWEKGIAANNLQEAATKTIQTAKDSRSNAVRDLYKAAGPVSDETRQALVAEVQRVLSQPGTTPEVKATGSDLIRAFSGKGNNIDQAVQEARMLVLQAPGGSARAAAQQQLAQANQQAAAASNTPLHALDADTAIGQAAGKFKGTPLTPADPKSAGQTKYLAGGLNQILQQGSPEVKQAEAVFAQQSHDVVDPLKKSPVGQLATPRGALPDVQASAAKIDAYFNAGSDPKVYATTNPIPFIASTLKAADPDAFPAAAKAFIRGKLDAATPANLGGQALSTGTEAQQVYQALFGNERKWQGMRDIAAGVARSYDFSPEQVNGVVKGVENLAQITRGLASQPNSLAGMTSNELRTAAGDSAVATGVRSLGIGRLQKAGQAIENWTMGNTYKEFDKLLTSPEGAAKLLELSKVPVMSNKAITILGSFWGTAPNALSAPSQLPAGQ